LHAEGRFARSMIETTRCEVAKLVGASPRDVVWTSGGSEAIAAAFHGVCARAPASRRRIVVASIEHSAVLESARQAGRHGFEVVEVRCDRDGRVAPEDFAEAAGETTALAALQAANPESGVLQPIDQVGAVCAERGIPFFVDAVQLAGKASIDFANAPIDLLALSAHKIGGPQGAGALIVRDGTQLAALVPGVQERRRRGGTEAVALLVGFGTAATHAQIMLDGEAVRLTALRNRIEALVLEHFPDARIHGARAERLPNTVLFEIPGIPGEALVIALDLAGFAVSTGSACASGAVEPSHVLRAMGFDEPGARGAVRVSLGWSTTAQDIDRFAEAFPAVAQRVRDALAHRS
jgi:cysteine desulfurase